MKKIKQVLLNPSVFGLLFVFWMAFFLTPSFQKYKLNILDHYSPPYDQIYFQDVDHDGFDERIRFSFDRDNKSFPTIEFRKIETLEIFSCIYKKSIILKFRLG